MKKFFKKFFVSSTFRDFMAERSMLLKKVIPEVRAESAKHGVDVQLVDLRWGLGTSNLDKNETVNKVLKVCLREVDNSYMIIFLGDRFGWVPDRELVSDEFASKFESVDEQSITALEIKYGLGAPEKFSAVESPRCLICMRDLSKAEIPEDFRSEYIETDEKSADQLKELKDWLHKNYSARIIEYSAEFDVETGQPNNFLTKDGNKPLSDAITSELLNDLKDEWSEYDSLSQSQRTLETAKNFVAHRADLFVGRKALLDDLRAKLEKSQCLFLRGLPGSGKTSVCCALTSGLSDECVCFISCGSSLQTSTARDVLQLMIYFLENETTDAPPTIASSSTDYDGLKNHLAMLCRNTDSDIYFFIDAIEQLSTDEHRDNLDFIPVCKNVHSLVTCTPDFKMPPKFFNPLSELDENIQAVLEPLSASVFIEEKMPSLEPDESIEVLSAMLAGKGKELFDETAAAVVAKKHSDNPLYLEMLAQALDMIDTPELTGFKDNPDGIVNLTVQFVEDVPQELPAAASHIVSEAIKRLCNKGDSVKEAMRLIAVSRHGLRMSDVQSIMDEPPNPLDWSLMNKYLCNFFVERLDGQLELSHNIIREGLRRTIDVDTFKCMERRIGEHIEKLPAGDSLRDAEIYYYVQAEKNFSLATELYAEAGRKQYSPLHYGIYESALSDNGDFIIEFLDEHLNDLPPETINAVAKFFLEYFPTKLFGGSKREFQLGQRICTKLVKLFNGFSHPIYYRIKGWLAIFEERLGNIDAAKKIYEETVRWGEENVDKLGAHLDSCRMISTAYDMLAKFARNADDSDLDRKYVNHCLEWSERALNLDTSPEAGKYRILTAVKRASNARFEEPYKVIDYYRRAYELCKSELQQNPQDIFYLGMAAKSCYPFINVCRESGHLEEALSACADGEIYVRLLLQIDANNEEWIKLAANLLADISLTEAHALEFEKAAEHSFEALRLLKQLYMQNPTDANKDLLQELADYMAKDMISE